ncbi:MAG TPA: hydrogenase maturation protease [Nitratifractor sp.]|nr:hydrogenase maturation protease [Nitratifractor sp.]
MVILGIGNVLEKDDGIGVYAASYLRENYTFSQSVKVINGGVEGINLYSVFEENENILILDTIELSDTPASIYLIPADELRGYGLNSGGAHEIGVMQCLDMLELQGKKTPKATLLGIIPKFITFEIDLSNTLKKEFKNYIDTALNYLKKEGIEATKNRDKVSLEEIIQSVRRV